jgi:phosphopantetheine--protein transferase-like protein
MVGIDLVYLPEFQKQLEIGGDHFLTRTFTLKELVNRQPEHLAGLWAAKEAVMKAAALKPGYWKEIVIEIQPNGSRLARLPSGMTLEVSISHHGDYAIAVAFGGKR